MSSSWVAASVRGRALARRRLGAAGARRIAASGSLPAAVAVLAESSYGHDVRSADTQAQAQHAVAATLLWHMRVLGGWVPRSGTPSLRALAAAFEIANIDEHLRLLQTEPAGPTFRLGSFATAWPRLVETTNRRDLCQVLTTSAWGDPGSEGVRAIRLYLRMSWAARVTRTVPFAQSWMAGAAALVVARERLVAERSLPESVVRTAEPLLGVDWVDQRGVGALREALPATARWVLDGIGEPTDLWRAEAAYWRRIEQDAFARLRGSSFDLEPTVAALVVLAVDAWRVRAALETASSQLDGLELFDAVA